MAKFSFDLPDLTILNAQVGTPQIKNTGTNVGGWLMVYNETPYRVTVEVGSARKLSLSPQSVDILELFTGDNFCYVTATRILSVSNPPSVTIKFKYFNYQPEGTYPVSLTRHAVTADPSGSIGFSSFVVITVATPTFGTSTCGLNIFNPGNSGVVFRIFSALIIPFGLSVVTANAAIRTDGTDNNFTSAIIFVRNISGAGSLAHVTFFQNQTIAAPNSFVGTANIYNTPYDFITASGGVVNAAQLYPGQNYLIDIQNPEVNALCSFALGWSEQ